MYGFKWQSILFHPPADDWQSWNLGAIVWAVLIIWYSLFKSRAKAELAWIAVGAVILIVLFLAQPRSLWVTGNAIQKLANGGALTSIKWPRLAR